MHIPSLSYHPRPHTFHLFAGIRFCHFLSDVNAYCIGDVLVLLYMATKKASFCIRIILIERISLTWEYEQLTLYSYDKTSMGRMGDNTHTSVMKGLSNIRSFEHARNITPLDAILITVYKLAPGSMEKLEEIKAVHFGQMQI